MAIKPWQMSWQYLQVYFSMAVNQETLRNTFTISFKAVKTLLTQSEDE